MPTVSSKYFNNILESFLVTESHKKRRKKKPNENKNIAKSEGNLLSGQSGVAAIQIGANAITIV